VVGDIIPSINKASQGGEKHFVSPKKTTELAEPYVTLKAAGVTKEEFERLFEWHCDTVNGQAVTGEPLNYRIKRDSAPAKNTVTIKVKNGGRDSDKINVWIIWATVVPRPITVAPPSQVDGALFYGVSIDTSQCRSFVFDIEPKEIFGVGVSPPEYPDLDRGNEIKPPGVGKHFIHTMVDADSALCKWDVSRKMKVTILNPTLIPRDILESAPNYAPFLWRNQPKSVDPIEIFPGPDAAGNDDPDLTPVGLGKDEDVEAYKKVGGRPDLDHEIGQISSRDAPEMLLNNMWGGLGRSIGIRYEFKEFARVELTNGTRAIGNGTFWFRISDLFSWHHVVSADWSYDLQNPSKSKWVGTSYSSQDGGAP